MASLKRCPHACIFIFGRIFLHHLLGVQILLSPTQVEGLYFGGLLGDIVLKIELRLCTLHGVIMEGMAIFANEG